MAIKNKQIKSFQDGMIPYPNIDGISRIEHFDIQRDQLKPYRGLAVSEDDTTTFDAIYDIIRVNSVTGATSGSNIFGLARNFGASRFAIVEWDITQQKWSIFKTSGADSNYALNFFYYNGKFIGLTNGTHLWTLTSAAVDLAAVALTYSSNDVYFLKHSKDGLCYIAVDNKIAVYNGTAITKTLTVQDNFLITSIAERGDYIMIVGYDSITYRSTAYLWDRDSSSELFTAKYDLGFYQTRHNATLEGTDFFVSLSWESSNTNFVDERSLLIGYTYQDKQKIVNKYRFSSISLGDKYQDGDNLYFTAMVKFIGDTDTHNLMFRLNGQGKLYIEQNLSINDTNNYALNGFVKDGDGFFIGHTNTDSAASCGYHTKEDYDVTSILELNAHRLDDITKNLDLIGGVIDFDPLPADSSIVVKTKADEESTWTTVRTFNTANSVKASFNSLDASGGQIETAKRRYWRLESLGGAIINSFRVDYEEKSSEKYG